MTRALPWRAAFWGAASGALTAALMLGLLARADAHRDGGAGDWCVVDEDRVPAALRPPAALPRSWRA